MKEVVRCGWKRRGGMGIS